jgi:regulatory protein
MIENKMKKSISLKARAVVALSKKEYSKQGLAGKLKPHANTPEELDIVLAELEQKQWLSNDRFAQSLVRKKSTKFGNRVLQQQLKQEGVDDEIVQDTLQNIEQEIERASQLIKSKIIQLSQLPKNEQLKLKHKLAMYLARRGFSGSTIQAVLKHSTTKETENFAYQEICDDHDS